MRDQHAPGRFFILSLAILLGQSLPALGAPEPARPAPLKIIINSRPDTFTARLAARELRRYIYLRTGTLPALPDKPSTVEVTNLAEGTTLIILDTAKRMRQAEALPRELENLASEEFSLRSRLVGPGKAIQIVGGDDSGLLYGAYRFCELLGIRFYLHGDTIPDAPLKELPSANKSSKPLFSIRGIQPFHDFPEGPDWWNRDDFLAYIAQLPKLRMNFLGLHCYPEGHPHAEPLVWIGLPGDQDEKGSVKSSYPAFWASTRRRGAWGYQPMPTSDFTGGAAQLFPSDNYAHEIQDGMIPAPETMAQCNELFNRAGAFLRDSFTLARQLGVKTCIGTETPLTVPRALRERLHNLGKDHEDPEVARELYQGLFQRIQKTHPLDYYWLWTPENWTWEEIDPAQVAATARDLQAALAALKSLGEPFTLATSGWVLGPKQDRAALDKLLPKTSPMSCINREVGHDLVEGGFAALQGRPKWSIPWMENDPCLTSIQLWAGRLRYDAVDSLKLGCTGLIGIHWRTKILSPNIAALAAAAWDQSFAPPKWDLRGRPRGQGPLGGRNRFSKYPVEGTSESIIYQWMREDLDGYDFDMPNGTYTVTLKFNEGAWNALENPNWRVFGIKLQGRTVLDRLNIYQRVGLNRALDLSFADTKVTNGHLLLEFTRVSGLPCVSAVVIEGKTDAGQPITRKTKCGWEAIAGYERDGFNDKPGTPERLRAMPVEDFYIDFARANFGEEVAAPAGRLFARIDGMNLPQTSHWEHGPGAINPLPLVPGEHKFVDELAALRPNVRGAGNLQRFDYWLNSFRFVRAMAGVGALRAELDGVMARLLNRELEAHFAKTNSPQVKTLAQEAIGVRIRLARAWEQMMSSLVAATDTPGELGTIANLEQHSRYALLFLNYYDTKLRDVLGGPLPPETEPAKTYRGPARLIVPAVRTAANKGENLNLRIFAVDERPMSRVELHWRKLGEAQFATRPARNLARSVFEVSLPSGADDIEYYLTAATAAGTALTWPPTAPALCQTVITLP